MKLCIRGQVLRKETGEPLAGLLVRVHDPEMILDDHLGAAVTDQQGKFCLEYSEQARQALLDGRHEIDLGVYAPPRRLLRKVTRKLRPNETSPAPQVIEISRKALGPHAAKPMTNQVSGCLALSARQLSLDTLRGFQLPRLPGFGESDETLGAPTVLEQVQYVVLPLGAKMVRLDIVSGPVTRKGRNVQPWPVQPLEMDIPDEPDSGIKASPRRFVALDSKYSRSGSLYPKNLVTLGRPEAWKGVQRLPVRVQPVQYDPANKQYLFYPKLRYIVYYEPASARALPKRPAAPHLRTRALVDDVLADFLEQTNVHAYPDVWTDRFEEFRSIGEIPGDYTPIIIPTPYLIITDEVAWNETNGAGAPPTQAGASLGGGIVAQFKRLAKWKTQRGVRARVVTVSQIIAEAHGDMTARNGMAALDLQEVIRNFIWWASENWHVRYVLFGGDTNLIPMRILIGYATSRGEATGWDCMRSNGDVQYHGAPHNIAKVRYCGGMATNLLFSGQLPLLTQQSGIQVQYYANVPSTHYPRWHFISKADFDNVNKVSGFTKITPTVNTDKTYYLLVEDNGAHQNRIDDDYYWVHNTREIPTDWYYAHAQAAAPAGAHDFDANGNGFYGQYRWDAAASDEVPLDGFNVDANVWVGRAPVCTAAEAEAFVDKVLAYERLTKQGTSPAMGLDFLRKVAHASGYRLHEGDFTLAPAANGGTFTYDATTQRAKLEIKADSKPHGNLAFVDLQVPAGQRQVNHRLIARYGNGAAWVAGAETDEVEIPYYTQAAGNSPHWHFTDATFANQGDTVTRYVRVDGLTAANGLLAFFWDPVGLTRPRVEEMRKKMLNWYPSFNDVKRMYRDHFEPNQDEPAIIPLRTQGLLDALNEGPHFLTIRAHGGKGGTCCLDTNLTYQNTEGSYIVFAMSCSTADPTNNPSGKAHSFGEKLVVTPGGGAVAYVGSARMDIDGQYADWFWEHLPLHRRLGPTAGQCRNGTAFHEFWRTYCRTLYGDPEMPVWVKPPKQYIVSCPTSAKPGDEILVTVKAIKNLPIHRWGTDYELYDGPQVDHHNLPLIKLGQPALQKLTVAAAHLNINNDFATVSVGDLDTNANLFILPVKDHLVTFMAGWDPLAAEWDKSTKAEWFRSKKTNAQGKVSIRIPNSLQADDKVEITICACDYASVPSRYTYKPVVRTLTITS